MTTEEPPNDDIENLLQELQASDSAELEDPTSNAQHQAPLHESPVLLALAAQGRATPSTVCRSCPQSLWFATQANLKCYCKAMFVVTYSDESPEGQTTLTVCDGLMAQPK